jgi:hypothetical protein
MPTPRALARGLAAGQRDGALAVPLALHVAARIQERDPEDFLFDATQLANALRDLADAAQPDGVVVTDDQVLLAEAGSPEALLKGELTACAVEATRRLRSSHGEQLVLMACLPGPVAMRQRFGISPDVSAETLLELAKQFLGAGTDVLLVVDDEGPETALATLANVARFHQALAFARGPVSHGLPVPTARALEEPLAGSGLVITPAQLPRETDIALLREWVDAVRAPIESN